jgi:hypothetical protein
MRFLLPITCLVALAGCAIIVTPGEGDLEFRSAFSSDAVHGNGQVSKEQRTIGTLTGLDMRGPLHVEVRVGQAPSLQVEADSNLLPMIRTEASGDTLRVWVEGNVRTTHSMRVVYTTPQLTQLRSSGSGRLAVHDLNGAALTFVKAGSGESALSGRVGKLDMELTGSGSINASDLHSGDANLQLTGSGRMNLGQVDAESINLKLRGSGDMQAAGKVTYLNARVLGSGGANLAGLASQRAELNMSGSGDLTAKVSASLVADNTGSGQITVYGNPAQRSVTGKHVRVIE